MYFYTSDLHVKEVGIARGFRSDTFKLMADFEKTVQDNWKHNVTDSDVVIVNGDIGIDMKFYDNLPGRKILVLGNHDTYSRSIYKSVFIQVCKHILVVDSGHRVYVEHKPNFGDIRVSYDYIVHGHWHDYSKFNAFMLGAVQRPNVLNALIDINGWCPCSLSEMIINNNRYKS